MYSSEDFSKKEAEFVHWSATFRARLKQFAALLQRSSGLYDVSNVIVPFKQMVKVAEQFTKDIKFSDLKTCGGVRLPALASYAETATRSLVNYAGAHRVLDPKTTDEFLGQLASRLDELAHALDKKLGITPQARIDAIEKEISKADAEIKRIEAEPLRTDVEPRKNKFRSLKDLQKAEARAVFASVIERMNDKSIRIKAVQARKSTLLEERKTFENASGVEMASDDNIQRAAHVIEKEAQNIKKQLEKAGVPNRVAFAIFRGGVIVNGTLNMKAFQSQSMNVYRIGEAYQKGGVGMGRAQEDARSRQFVLTNQWILAIKNQEKPKVLAAKSVSRTHQLLKKAKRNQGVSQGPSLLRPPPDLTFATVLSIIKAKTGKQYIDVAGVSTNNSPYEMRSREIPGVRFIWLMEKSDYLAVSRSGNPLHVTEASMPALSKMHAPKKENDEPSELDLAKRRQLFGLPFGGKKPDEDSSVHMKQFGVPRVKR